MPLMLRVRRSAEAWHSSDGRSLKAVQRWRWSRTDRGCLYEHAHEAGGAPCRLRRRSPTQGWYLTPHSLPPLLLSSPRSPQRWDHRYSSLVNPGVAVSVWGLAVPKSREALPSELWEACLRFLSASSLL